MSSGAELAMLIRAKDEASAVFEKVKGSAGGMASGITSAMSGLALAGGAVSGIIAMGSAVAGAAQSMIGGNAAMETYQTQLTTLMGSSDAAKDRIAQLAKIGAETPFELTELVKAEKIMMGFGLNTEKTMQLSGRSLDQYRTAIGDMAAATGAPLDEVTLLWSKFGSGATGEAISRLQELGIVTREQMAEMGIQFSKSGELTSPIPEAMKVAMDLAEKKMGGGMKALSSTFEGQMSTLSDNFNQAKVILMQPIFEVLKSGLTSLNETLSGEQFTAFVKSVAEQGAAFISTAIEIGTALAGLFNGGDDWEGVGALLDKFFPPAVSDAIMATVSDLGGLFNAVFGGDIPTAIGAALLVIEDLGNLIASSVESWASSFASWVDGADTEMTGQLGELITGLMGWIQSSATAIIEKLAVWAGAFVDWVGPKIPPLLAALGSLLAELLGWVLTVGLPDLISKLAEWGLALVAWVAPRIGPLLAALGGLLVALGGWLLGTALPAIVSQLLQWGDAFTAWVIPMIPQLIVQLLVLQGQLIAWIAGQVAGIGVALAAWGVAFLAWVAQAVAEIPGKLGEILSAITGWIGGAVGAVQASARSIGQAIIDGISGGISAGIGAIQSMAANAANSALSAAKAALGIESPSKVFNKEVGQMMMLGAIGGINVQKPALMAATKAAMVPAVAAAADVVSSLSEQANAMAEAARQQAMAASKATNMSDFLDSVQGLGDVFGKGISLPTPIFGPRADERGWDGTKPLPDAIFRPVSPVSDRSQPIFGPQPVVNNITVQGSLIHESELDRVIGNGLFSSLRYNGSLLGSR